MFKLFVLVALFSLISCNQFNWGGSPFSSEKELKENLIKHKVDISNLKHFYNSITPKNMEIRIEFTSDNSIDLSIYYVPEKNHPKKIFFQQWDINPYDYKMRPSSSFDSTDFTPETNSLDVVKKKLGWTNQTFKSIKAYLDKANCISVTNGDPTNVGFKRSGMGMYFYNLFDKTLNDSLKKAYNDSCRYRIYNDTVVLEYGGGAIGSQCFPNKWEAIDEWVRHNTSKFFDY